MNQLEVFISSTCYEMGNIRETLKNCIEMMGHKAVMCESMYYASDLTAEDSCYENVKKSDIIIHIIGKYFGSPSKDEEYSVAQKELKTAIENKKPKFVFIQVDVLNDFNSYNNNTPSARKRMKYNCVQRQDAEKLFNFIKEIRYDLNIPMFTFEDLGGLQSMIKNQFSGLFKEKLENRKISAEDYFTQSYTQLSNEFYQDLSRCKALDVIGLGQDRMIKTIYEEYKKILKRHGNIRFILTDPDSVSTEMCARRSSGDRKNIENDRGVHKTAINRLLDLNVSSAEIGEAKVYIADFMYPYTMYAFDLDNPTDTRIYVWITPLFEPSSNRLGFLLMGSRDRTQTESFRRQFNTLLSESGTKEVLQKYVDEKDENVEKEEV